MDDKILNLFRKYNTIINIDEMDKERVKNLIDWVTDKGIEMTISEKSKKDMIVKQKEVWTCDLGVNIGSEMNKIRPVVILQNDNINKNSNTILVAPITSRFAYLTSHVPLTNDNLEYVEENICGTVMLEQVRTVSKARLGRRIGKVNDETFKTIQNALFKVILNENEEYKFEKVDVVKPKLNIFEKIKFHVLSFVYSITLNNKPLL